MLLDHGVAHRQLISDRDKRPDNPRRIFNDLKNGKLSLHPHPEWESDNILDWNANPYNDNNWQFQHHTLRFLTAVRYLALEGDTEARDFWLGAVKSWAEANTPIDKARSKWAWADMADGVRALQLCLGAPLTSQADHWFVDLLAEHRDWLKNPANIAPRNHGMHQLVGLFVTSCCLKDDNSARFAISQLNDLFRKTFRNDGTDDEGAPIYLAYNVNWWQTTYQRIQAEGYEIPVGISTILEKARTALAFFSWPSSHLVQIGDTPRGGLTMSVNEHSEFVLSKGTKGVAPKKLSQNFENEFLIFRNKWQDENDSHTLVRYGSYNLGHSHRDQGSFTLFASGQPWIVDPGFWNYQPGDPMRKYTLARDSHNVSFIVGLEHDDFVPVALEHFSDSHDTVNVVLCDGGYPNVVLTRQLVFFRKLNLWVVIDKAKSDTPLTLRHQFLIDHGVGTILHDRGYILRAGEKFAYITWIGRETPRYRQYKPSEDGSGDLRGWIATSWNRRKLGTSVEAFTKKRDNPLLVCSISAGDEPASLLHSDVNSKGVVSLGVMHRGIKYAIQIDGIHIVCNDTSKK